MNQLPNYLCSIVLISGVQIDTQALIILENLRHMLGNNVNELNS